MSKKTSSSGIGFTGALTLLFVYLKLTKQIDWPWIWVASPIWIVILLVMAFWAAYILISSYFEERKLDKELEKLLKNKNKMEQENKSFKDRINDKINEERNGQS